MLQMLLWKEFILNMFRGWKKVLVPMFLFLTLYFPTSIYHEGVRFLGSGFALLFSLWIFSLFFFGIPPIVYVANVWWRDLRNTKKL